MEQEAFQRPRTGFQASIALPLGCLVGSWGETLTSISKHYGVSIYSVAVANRHIVDIDLVFLGQLLHIPCSAPGDAQVCGTLKSWLPSFIPVRHEDSSKITDGLANQNIFTMITTPCSLPHVKTTGYFLVLVPLIALCIRCIMSALHSRFVGDVKRQTLNKPKGHLQGSKNSRWKSALGGIADQDILDSQSRSDSYNPSEDQSQTSFEDLSGDYLKLEHDYQKFLRECGMSEWGYWRGGSTK